MFIRSLYLFLAFLIFMACSRKEDTVFVSKVTCSSDSTAIGYVNVDVIKRKPAMIWGYKTIDIYNVSTDENGIGSILIDDYNREDYDYMVMVNAYGDIPPDFGGYTYSQWGTILEEYELDDTLRVKLTRIPYPDIEIGY